MTTPTVTRADAVVRRIARLDVDSRRREAVALGLVDALLERDGATVAAVLDALRNARARADGDAELAGWLDAAIAFAHWGLERIPSQAAAVVSGTQAHDFLRALEGSAQVGSADLRRRLETDETQVSRTGRRLLEGGLVSRRKAGRQVFWSLTPRGRRALAEAPAAPRPATSGFWQEALRRGFEAASGDQPGEPREVDPTRELIIRTTLQLHDSRGVQATTFADVAAEAGVPVETVQAHFQTSDDLIRGCGAHFMESLRLPPRDRAADVFAGATSENERIHRLVETFFGAYERGASGFDVGRRERNEVPVLGEAVDELDATFDALVSEALRPLGPDATSVASVRALTDLEVWRTLRDRDATPEAAVDEASAAVERWLEARPAR